MKILVAMDFSEESMYGLDSAYSLCAEKKGEIIIAHVIEDLITPSFSVMGIASKGSREQDIYMKLLIDKVKERLEALVVDERYREVKMSYHMKVGKVFDKIRDIISQDAPDFLIMGSRGDSGLHEVFIGSNAEKMSRFSPCPLMIVKRPTDLTKVKNVVYPTDFKAEQKNIIGDIKYIQSLFGAHLHLVKVFDPVLVTDADVMQKMVNFVEEHGVTNCTPNVWHHHDESEGVLEFAGSIDADMITMGTHGRRGVAALVGGNISQHLINHTNIPICTINMRLN